MDSSTDTSGVPSSILQQHLYLHQEPPGKMKRSGTSQDPEPPREKSFRRQEPVSCQFCRRKKLKCDRVSPCSNCRARKLTCSSATESAQAPTVSQNPAPSDPAPSNQNIDDLNARVKKLEQLLTEKSSTESRYPVSTERTSISYPKKPDETPEDVEILRTVSWLETDAFEHAASPVDEALPTESRIADSFGSFIFSLTKPPTTPSLDRYILAMLPTRGSGKVLLEYYLEHINWIYHILHVPTVWKMFDNLYDTIEQKQRPDYGHLALLSTLYALSAYFSSPTSSLHFTSAEAMTNARKWILLAQDTLSAANCLATPTVETLQCLILISQHLMPNIGALSTLRTLASTSVQTARAMGLHKIDSAANKKRREHMQVDYVDLETKRKIWWHVASADWLLSFMSGSQCGTYMVHPKQMAVDWPTNVDDNAITADGNYAQPLCIPTESTYLIYRIKFSEIFRQMADAAWEVGTDVDDLPYELVLLFDRKLTEVLAEFERNCVVMSNKTTAFTTQCSMGHFGIHSRLSRLHRPYLIRGAQNPQYAYSRMVCLRSARTVIEIAKKMTESKNCVESIKIWSFIHHVFVAIVVLVMDYCFNREEPRAKERKAEILDCFRMLESSESESTVASRGLIKLRGMLRDGGRGEGDTSGSDTADKALEPTREVSKVRQEQMSKAQMQHATPSATVLPNQYTSAWSFPADPASQYQWFDYASLDNSLDNVNFDVNLDVGQFETLFHNFDGNNSQIF